MQALTLSHNSLLQEFAMREGRTGWVGDVAFASAIARTVRAVPGVADLPPGAVAKVATYGTGQRVDGIVVHHLSPDAIALEIHVALSESDSKRAVAESARDASGRTTEEIGVLPIIAGRIRSAVYDIAQGMAPPALTQVDVFIDDLR